MKSEEKFRSLNDPLFEVTGSAYLSNPNEVNEIIDTLSKWGVEINETDSLGYRSPSVSHPGGMSVTENASFVAWLHEYEHAKDAHTHGWLMSCIQIRKNESDVNKSL